ncbi:MAG: hypothetical protein ACKO1J_12485 [Tagaea sp.]
MNRKIAVAIVALVLAGGAAFALGARETAQAPAPAAREARAPVVAPGRVEPAT